MQELLSREVKAAYPQAVLTFSPPETIFEKLFVTGEADVVAQLHPENRSQAPEPSVLQELETRMMQRTGLETEGIAFRNQMNLVVDRERLLLYNVAYNELTRVLRTAFKENKVSTLRSYQQYLPVGIAGEERSINDILSNTLVQTQPDGMGNVNHVPVSSLVKVVPGEDLKSITAGKNGEYIPVSFYDVTNAPKLMDDIDRVQLDWELM